MARQFILVTMRGTALDGKHTIVSTYLIRDVLPATEGSTIRCKSGYPDYPVRETIDELAPWLVDPEPELSQPKSPVWTCSACGHGAHYPGSPATRGMWFRRCALCHKEDRHSVTSVRPPQKSDA